MDAEPLDPPRVKKRLIEIMATGTLAFSNHAYEEMAKDHMIETDVLNTLRSVYQPVSWSAVHGDTEPKRRAWRQW